MSDPTSEEPPEEVKMEDGLERPPLPEVNATERVREEPEAGEQSLPDSKHNEESTGEDGDQMSEHLNGPLDRPLDELKDENHKLSEDVLFAQNIVKLLENYRNLIIVCLNQCQNCAHNPVLVQEFNELELTYDRDLTYAKDVVFDKTFYQKINRIFNRNRKKSTTEPKYEILDDYIDTDSEDMKNSLDPDSDYEPNEEMLAEVEEPKPVKPKKRGRKPKAKPVKRGRTKKAVKYDDIDEAIDDIIDQLDNEDKEIEDNEDHAWNKKPASKKRGRGRPKAKGVAKVQGGAKKRYDKVYKCDLCEYTHRKPPNLEAHKNKVHLNIRPYKCDKCSKCFTGKPFLDKHRRFHNESDASYHYCDWTDCKFRTKYMNNLKEHRLRHERDRQFRCAWPGCGQSFYNNRDMTQHMKSHEDQRTYRCDWPGCESTFKRHTYLSRHKRLHMNSDDAFPCVWPGCGKAFNTKKKLANHSSLHKKQLEENVHQMVRQQTQQHHQQQTHHQQQQQLQPQQTHMQMSPGSVPLQVPKRSVIQNQLPNNKSLQQIQQHMSQSQMAISEPSVAKMAGRLADGRLSQAHTHQMQASAQQFVRTDPGTPTPTDLSQHRPQQVYNAWSLNNFYH